MTLVVKFAKRNSTCIYASNHLVKTLLGQCRKMSVSYVTIGTSNLAVELCKNSSTDPVALHDSYLTINYHYSPTFSSLLPYYYLVVGLCMLVIWKVSQIRRTITIGEIL